MRVTSVRRAWTRCASGGALSRDTTEMLGRRGNTLIAASILRLEIGGQQRLVYDLRPVERTVGNGLDEYQALEHFVHALAVEAAFAPVFRVGIEHVIDGRRRNGRVHLVLLREDLRRFFAMRRDVLHGLAARGDD